MSVAGNVATCWGTRSAKTGNYYTVDVGAEAIREVQLDRNLNASLVAVRVAPLSPVVDAVVGCADLERWHDGAGV